MIQIIILILTLTACKEAVKETDLEVNSENIELTTAESIAEAHGISDWKKVRELQFTFNVERGERGYGRTYIWNTQTDDITFISEGDTLQYNRKGDLDSLSLGADQRFINDSFWLISPFKLVQDEGTTISEGGKTLAPISNDSLNKITMTYGSEGGYTPGDAYDFYFDDNFMIKEWVYRRGNSPDPGLMTKWSDYSKLEGLKLATTHTDSAETWKLFFTDLAVKK